MFQSIKLYFQESWTELRRVNWPTRQETLQMTIIVIGFSLLVAAFLGLLDFLFQILIGKFILKV